MTIGNLASAVAIIFIMPLLSKLIVKKYKLSPMSRDLVLMRITAALTAAGLIMVAFAPSLALFMGAFIVISFGVGFAHLLRAVLSAIVEPHALATLFTLNGLITSVVSFGGVPFLSWVQGKGQDLGGTWEGLQFIVMAAVMLGITVSCFVFRLPRKMVDV